MDFGSMSGMSSKASMKRKQSNSLLGAFGKSNSSRISAIPIPSSSAPPLPTPASSHFHSSSSALPPVSASDEFPIHSPDSPRYPESTYSRERDKSQEARERRARERSASSTFLPGGGRVVSSKFKDKEKEKDRGGGDTVIRKPEDIFKVVKERLFSWSYMMQWYQGDVHWFNTVKIPRQALETSLGPGKVDQRARNMFVLGASLAALFDIQQITDFLKATLKMLDEWESWTEGSSKGVKGIFQGKKDRKRSTGGASESVMHDNESYLLMVNLPFTPDFFQVHSSACSIIRDLYKKLLGMVLPHPTSWHGLPRSDKHSLFHPSTFIHSARTSELAPLNSALPHGYQTSITGSNSFAGSTLVDSNEGDPKSPGGFSINSFGDSSWENTPMATTGRTHRASTARANNKSADPSSTTQHDAFQAFILGELPSDRSLVGDGQKLTPQVIELFLKVDAKLRKHFSVLLREGDALARRILDDELAVLLSSLTSGPAMKFDVRAALSGGIGGNVEGVKSGMLHPPPTAVTLGGGSMRSEIGRAHV